MLGELSETQIENLLKQQVTGRIACHAEGTTYIVPVNYVYDGTYIYGHSSIGKKIEMMRKNPEVCFEVDDIKSVFKWQSVIAWGRFEEIIDIKENEQAMQRLIHRIMPLSDNATDHPSHGITESDSDIGANVELIVYRIKVSRKTGRFEQS
jgi:nitroimidazol reductase NimA-like FMN-containing flavoprotein (pyridoxamine 5'-phosphate oxidase superfamily)